MYRVLLTLLLISSLRAAPVPADRAKEAFAHIFLAENCAGYSLDAGPDLTPEEFAKREVSPPKFKIVDTIDDLKKEFAPNLKLKDRLPQFYSPTRHRFLFARWYSFHTRSTIAVGVVDQAARLITFEHKLNSNLRQPERQGRVEHNYVFIVSKDAKWKLGTLPDE